MREIRYISTRGDKTVLKASEAILKGIADDGGLYVPEEFPKPSWDFDKLKELDYKALAYEVLSLFLTDYTEDELKECIKKAYDEKFDDPSIVPMKKAGDAYYLELWHGATAAFKDMALSILPHLMVTAARKNHCTDEIVILTATSGDTGKAALAGFANVSGTKIIVFYPKDGVSTIQERQMITQAGDNTHVIAVKGNFDDAQTGVKKLFTDKSLNEQLKKKGYQFSSANSINIGRLMPQVVYYVFAYCRLLSEGVITSGEPMNVCVPTGNFGNILAAYYAKQIGLPIKTFLCASNENKVLYDFFKTGSYDRKRAFILTSSPSMDILISSNLERLIYQISTEKTVAGSKQEAFSDGKADTSKGEASTQTRKDVDTSEATRKATQCAALMKSLREEGHYSITKEMKEQLVEFYGGFASEEACAGAIRENFTKNQYCIDTHTGVAAAVYNEYRNTSFDTTPTVIVSTASPYKFTGSVLKALSEGKKDEDDFALVDTLYRLSGVKIPDTIRKAKEDPIRHKNVCEIDEMKAEVLKFLQL